MNKLRKLMLVALVFGFAGFAQSGQRTVKPGALLNQVISARLEGIGIVATHGYPVVRIDAAGIQMTVDQNFAIDLGSQYIPCESFTYT